MVFGPFGLDVAQGRLIKDGTDVELRRQAFEALRVLIQNNGRYVDYRRLIQEAWSGTVVSRHTVAVTVWEAKKALREYGSWIHYRPKLGYRLDIPETDELIRAGWHFSRRYTREGLEKGLDYFERAASTDSTDSRSFEGSAFCYLMLGAYGMRPPREMYPKFLEAHSHTVALKGMTPELLAQRAHALHIFERELGEAEAELLQAAKDEPGSPTIQGHLAILYASSGRDPEAQEALARAYHADALHPALPSIEVLVHLCARQFDLAIASGRKAVELHPYLPLGRHLYAQALECSGHIEQALAEYRLTATMSPDFLWLRAQEASCIAKAGRREEALRLLSELEQLRQTDYVDAYSMAVLMLSLGRVDAAFAELERALEENAAPLFILDVDAKMDPLRADPRFATVRNRVFRGAQWNFVRAAS